MPGFLNTSLRSPTHPILLRPASLNDATSLSRILSTPENIQFDPFCSKDGVSVAQCEAMITRDRISASEPIPTRVPLVIVLLPFIGSPDEGQVIGLGGFGGIDEKEDASGEKRRFGDVGAMIDPGYRGRGYAVESMRLSIEFAFRELRVDGISCQMMEKNEAIVGLVENVFGWKGVRVERDFGTEVGFEVGEGEWAETRERLKARNR